MNWKNNYMDDKKNIEIEKSKIPLSQKIWNMIKRLFCLLFPVGSSFAGYFLSPYIWTLLNHKSEAPGYFSFICIIVFFAITTSIIFLCTRKENPIIKITIKNKEDDDNNPVKDL